MRKHLTGGRIAGYLLYFALACTLVTGVAYARYGTVVTGSGTADVAAVALESTLDLTGKLTGLAPGGSKKVSFTVGNEKEGNVSEVTQQYSVTLTTTGNLPLTYTLKAQGDSGAGAFVATSPVTTGLTQTWDGGRLPHTEATTHTYQLTVEWPSGAAAAYADEIDLVSLTVDAVQAEPAAIP